MHLWVVRGKTPVSVEKQGAPIYPTGRWISKRTIKPTKSKTTHLTDSSPKNPCALTFLFFY
jgi:hypothetical protein